MVWEKENHDQDPFVEKKLGKSCNFQFLSFLPALHLRLKTFLIVPPITSYQNLAKSKSQIFQPSWIGRFCHQTLNPPHFYKTEKFGQKHVTNSYLKDLSFGQMRYSLCIWPRFDQKKHFQDINQGVQCPPLEGEDFLIFSFQSEEPGEARQGKNGKFGQK